MNESTVMHDSYLTLSAPGAAEFIEKRSRFISFAAHVETEEEAKDFVAAIRKRFYDARHVCYAYALGADVWTEEFDPIARGVAVVRANDDGEPGGSAGKPILGQLRSRGLTYAVVAVVRYFGGVKLGTGGLAVAYRTGASLALDAATTEEQVLMAKLVVEVPYADQDAVLRVVREGGADIIARDYTAISVVLTVSVRQKNADILRERLEKIYTIIFHEQ